jgi:hypothetical protein
MSEAIAEVIGVAARENLGLGFEAAEGAGVDDAVTVALKVVAVGVLRLGVTASAGVFRVHRVVSEHGKSLVSKFEGFKVRRQSSVASHQHRSSRDETKACIASRDYPG